MLLLNILHSLERRILQFRRRLQTTLTFFFKFSSSLYVFNKCFRLHRNDEEKDKEDEKEKSKKTTERKKKRRVEEHRRRSYLQEAETVKTVT